MVVVFSSLQENTYAACSGKEWSLGRAVQVSYQEDNDAEHRYKAQFGTCVDDDVEFTNPQYFASSPSTTELSEFYGTLHDEVWLSVPEKSRAYYVLEEDWRNDRTKIVVTSVIAPLLLLNNNDIPLTPTVYTPDNPNPAAETETPVDLTDKSWQKMYEDGETFCQVSLRSDGTIKIKFCIISGSQAIVFNVEKNILPPTNWMRGEAPLDLSTTFPEYTFKNEMDPGDNEDVWTAQVLIPGYNM